MFKRLKILFVLFIVLVNTLKAQHAVEKVCGNSVPQNYQAKFQSVMSTQNLVANLNHDTCLNKKFSVVFYVIADSNYTWGPPGGPALSPAALSSCISNLNAAFKPICVGFLNCSTVVIPNYPYNRWWQNITHPIVTANWRTINCINIYLVDSIKLPLGASGYAGSEIVIEKSAIAGTTPIHEMGHFFGLIHTFDDMTNPAPSSTLVPNPLQPLTSELVNRTNCYTNGDGFCDTEADCFPFNGPTGPISACNFYYGPKDANLEYFNRPVDNYMTYKSSCRNKFTQQQYNFMAAYILTNLLYLH